MAGKAGAGTHHGESGIGHFQIAFAGEAASVDALRGLIVFAMIFVNDLAGAPASLVPRYDAAGAPVG